MNRSDDDGGVLCRPHTTAWFQIEDSITVDGIHAEIRHFAWDHSCNAQFETDGFYIDYSLGPRSAGSRLIGDGRGNAGPFGDVAFMPRGAQFQAHCSPSEYRILCLTFETWTSARIVEREDLAPSLPHCFDVKCPAVRQGLARLAQEVRNPGFAHDVLVQSISLSLLVDLARHFQHDRTRNAGHNARLADWRLRRLKDRIAADLSVSLSIADLADECGMSARHLMRTFRNTVGMTISDYIAQTRITAAKHELLRDGTLIKVVAGHCGFHSAAAFTAAFHKATGMTPRHFRDEVGAMRRRPGAN
jgi:AraC family transcriptional regulator